VKPIGFPQGEAEGLRPRSIPRKDQRLVIFRSAGLSLRPRPDFETQDSLKFDELVKSPVGRHPGGSRGPEHLEITGFRLPPE